MLADGSSLSIDPCQLWNLSVVVVRDGVPEVVLWQSETDRG